MPLAIVTYEAYKLVHILSAVVWLGGGLMLSVLGARIARQDDPRRMAAFARDVEWLGNRVLVPASLLVLVFGFLLIWDGPWMFGQLWIQLALGLFGVTFVTGAFFLGPQAGKTAKLIEQLGPEAAAVQAQIRRLLFVSRLDLLTLYSILVVMVAKPEPGDALLFTIWAAALAGALVGVVLLYRRESEAVEPAPAVSE